MHPTEIEDNSEHLERNVSKAEYYISQLNVNNAKKVALCLVLGFIFYHGLIHLRYGKSTQNEAILLDFRSNIVFKSNQKELIRVNGCFRMVASREIKNGNRTAV